jgi:hypothetical protein
MRTLSFILFLISTTASFASGYTPQPVNLATTNPTLRSKADQPGSKLAQRALKPVHTLSDKIGRELVAKIIKVKANSLEVRRHADRRILEIPLALLCHKDMVFARYLWQQEKLKQNTGTLKEANMTKQLATTIKELDSILHLKCTSTISQG